MADEEESTNGDATLRTPSKQNTETEIFSHQGIEDLMPDDDSVDLIADRRNGVDQFSNKTASEWLITKTSTELPSFGVAESQQKEFEGENLKYQSAGCHKLRNVDPVKNLNESDQMNSEEFLHISTTLELKGGNVSETEFRKRHTNDRPTSTLDPQYQTVESSDDRKSHGDVTNTKIKACEKESINKTESLSSKQAVSEEKLESSVERLSFMKYFTGEVFHSKLMELAEDKYTERREKVYIFMTIPREFEKLMVFGFMLCLDCFLFMFTFLPLRMIVALFKIAKGLLLCRTARILQPAQICDLLKGSILLACWILLTHVDFSVLYHTVRGQSVIKLYVIYNMLEIADRLFSSFGQDILDALFWTATEPKDSRREHIGIIPHFAMAVAYVFFHAILVLFQAICLNVAVNSHNKALLVIMVSNQFVELKGSVFKRFEKNNLFQMACSDIRERFHYIVLISVVTLRNLTEFNWNFGHLYEISPYLLAVLSSEYFVDWIKHAFITKFNNIPVEVYCEYRAFLAEDATSSRQKNAHADHFDLVSRRLGFIPLPLGSLVVKVVGQSAKLHGFSGALLLFSSFVFLTTVKVLNSIIFLGKASQFVHDKQQESASIGNQASVRNLAGDQFSSTSLDSSRFARRSSFGERDMGLGQGERGQTKRRAQTLAEIDRYTLCSKEIVVF